MTDLPKMKLKAARVNVGLTQAEAANEIGVSVSTLKNWESGNTFPKQPFIIRICDVYNISYDLIDFS